MKSSFLIILFFVMGCSQGFCQTYNEILGRPTDSSITISILFNQQSNDVYWEYGTVSGTFNLSTNTYIAPIDTPLEVDFINLTPNTKYFYRTRYRTHGSSSAFSTGTVHSFYTQRAPGSTFTFTIEADEHLYDKKGNDNLYKVCLANQAMDNPDFMIDLGDIFGDDHHPFTITSYQLDSLHKNYRPLLGNICNSVPLYLCLGNHEGEKDYYLLQTPPNNMAVYATLWRKFYYPNPYPDNFYTGDTTHELYGIGQPENYYAWTWGNALFVVLDVYRDDCDTSAKPINWNWTLGYPQYEWLRNTLATSNAQYKFVFAHHTRGEGRGGISTAPYFEWGGYEANGVTWGFTTNRPGWAEPIHQLFVHYGVNIFFQGHDHLFAHEIMNGVTYQEVPMPSDSTYSLGIIANGAAYVSDTIRGSGHVRVTVSPNCVNVDFVKAYLPADTISGANHNRQVAFSYSIGNCSTSVLSKQNENIFVNFYPNPAKDYISVSLPGDIDNYLISLVNVLGQRVLQTHSKNIDITNIKNGIYFLNIKTSNHEINKKLIVDH